MQTLLEREKIYESMSREIRNKHWSKIRGQFIIKFNDTEIGAFDYQVHTTHAGVSERNSRVDLNLNVFGKVFYFERGRYPFFVIFIVCIIFVITDSYGRKVEKLQNIISLANSLQNWRESLI